MGHKIWCYLFQMFHLLMFLPLDYVQPLQLFLIFQKLHNFLPVTNQPLFRGLIKGKSRDIQKLLKKFNGTRIFASNLFFFFFASNLFALSGMLLKRLTCCFLVVIYLIIISIIFIYGIIHFISKITPQTYRCYIIISTIFQQIRH